MQCCHAVLPCSAAMQCCHAVRRRPPGRRPARSPGAPSTGCATFKKIQRRASSCPNTPRSPVNSPASSRLRSPPGMPPSRLRDGIRERSIAPGQKMSSRKSARRAGTRSAIQSSGASGASAPAAVGGQGWASDYSGACAAATQGWVSCCEQPKTIIVLPWTAAAAALPATAIVPARWRQSPRDPHTHPHTRSPFWCWPRM